MCHPTTMEWVWVKCDQKKDQTSMEVLEPNWFENEDICRAVYVLTYEKSRPEDYSVENRDNGEGDRNEKKSIMCALMNFDDQTVDGNLLRKLEKYMTMTEGSLDKWEKEIRQWSELGEKIKGVLRKFLCDPTVEEYDEQSIRVRLTDQVDQLDFDFWKDNIDCWTKTFSSEVTQFRDVLTSSETSETVMLELPRVHWGPDIDVCVNSLLPTQVRIV